MKDKLFVIIGCVLFLVGCGTYLYYVENKNEVYYTRIDNTRVEKLSSSSDMPYEYTLTSYNEKGKKKELKFKTSRELKEGAYLSLTVRSFGVHKWEEVSYEEMPTIVQEKYKE